jgi:hypothetical protein
MVEESVGQQDGKLRADSEAEMAAVEGEELRMSAAAAAKREVRTAARAERRLRPAGVAAREAILCALSTTAPSCMVDGPGEGKEYFVESELAMECNRGCNGAW